VIFEIKDKTPESLVFIKERNSILLPTITDIKNFHELGSNMYPQYLR